MRAGFTLTRWETGHGVHERATRVPGSSAGRMVTRYAGYTEHGLAFRRREIAGSGVGLVLAFGDPLISEDGQCLGAFAFGNQTKPSVSTVLAHQAGVQIDLTALGARSVLHVEPLAMTDSVVPLDVALGALGNQLLDQLASASSWSDRFDLLDATFGALPAVELAPEVDWVLGRLAASGGQGRLEPLVRETGWSPRHFTRRFLDQVGLAPKNYARLVRFERAVELMKECRGMSLADVAASTGFFDQAHLSRDFRSFAGCAPGAFLAELDPDPEVRFVQDDEVNGSLRSAQ